MRIAKTITLTNEERVALQKWSRGRSTPSRLVLRSKIVLAAAAGQRNDEIAADLKCTRRTVGTWRNRFASTRLAGIEQDAPRGGRTPTQRIAFEAEIIRRTTQETPLNATQWSTRSLADAIGGNDTMVHRVWRDNGLKPHLSKTFKVSNDPRFAEKLVDVVGLYLNPPEHALVLDDGESRQITFAYVAQDATDSSAEANVTVTIHGVNDSPTLTLSLPDQNATEDSAFSFVVPLNTFADVDAEDSLTYSATRSNGNALPSWLNFDAATRTFSGTPRFGDVGTLSVKVAANDGDASVSDTFDLVVAAVTNLPRLSINDVTVTEGTGGTVNATFQVTLSASSLQTVTANFATANGTATAPADYRVTSGLLTFAPGQTSKTITVPVMGDSLDEAAEMFLINLSGAVNAAILDGQGQGTITDNDNAPMLSINNVTVTEGTGSLVNAVFTVKLNVASGQSVSVHYATSDGTAFAPGDYTSNSGTVTFAPGETSQPITVSVSGDVLDEAIESFVVNLSDATNATIRDAHHGRELVGCKSPV